MRRRRVPGGERGAVILLVSLIMTVLLIIVSFAIDLGTARATKRDAQAIADLAALDAGYFLAGSSRSAVGVAQPFQACIAAVESVQRNVPGFLADFDRGDIEDACSEIPETIDGCDLDDPLFDEYAPWKVELEDGERRLTIRYPILGEELEAGRFPEGGAHDGSDPCERIGVDLRKVNTTAFARIVGVGEMTTTAGVVVRGNTAILDGSPPAVLLLERTACQVFGNSASGSGNLGIVVEAYEETPGLIHADTNATASTCSGTSAGAYGIYGTPLSGGAPSIVVADGAIPADGSPQRLGAIRTAATNGQGAATFPGGLSVAPTVGGIVSRAIVDDKYNDAENPAIKTLHEEAVARLLLSGAPVGHHIVGCTQAELDAARTALHTKLYVNCTSVGSTLNFSGFTDVVFAGSIDLKGTGGTITLGDATTVTVRGTLNINTGSVLMPAVRDLTVGAGVSTSTGTSLAVNNSTAAGCSGREGPTWKNWTKMTVFGGSPALSMSGNVALCQTVVYLAGPVKAQFETQKVEAGGSCSSDLPCPKVTGNTVTGANFALGQGAVVHWSAPNQHDTRVEGTAVGLEDLALWTESAGISEIKSGSELVATGVYFGPNANFQMSSPATGTPRDAQFVARRGWMTQGTLRVAPNPVNSVLFPVAGSYGLIR